MQVALVADDLTGALDSVVQFFPVWRSAEVLLFEQSGQAAAVAPEAEVCGLDMNSRGSTARDAALTAAAAARFVMNGSPGIVYKKVDSTLRGNIGAECDAILEAAQFEFCIFAPAVPRLGRTTRLGVQLVHGLPVHRTELAADPMNPVVEGHIPSLLSRQSRYGAGMLSVEACRDQTAFDSELRRLSESGVRYVVADAETDEDLRNLVNRIDDSGRNVLWAGAAGLASALAGARAGVGGSGDTLIPTRGDNKSTQYDGPVLYVSGSRTQLTKLQIGRLAEQSAVIPVTVAPDALLPGNEDRSSAAAERAGAILRSGRSTALIIEDTDQAAGRLTNWAVRLGMTAAQLNASLVNRMGELAAMASGMAEHSEKLVVIGGETSRGVCRAFRANRLTVAGELLPGVVLSGFKSGAQTDVSFVTKSGSFGDEYTLVQLHDALRSH
ncbi:four-carbon acid sugar kinase family protein [Paenibacillus alkalitolerans]|uniref:four-carbon acid sugar kinase family protein n=1 Tax=Paenibacillus alkalitolerans TaxID=2799335 RepID=UPI0018F56BC9|nr:four-carbon acid sugar kinase family protein [Paenibacillus alkalitolerans]